MAEKRESYNTTSVLALSTIPHESEEDRQKLEGVLREWLAAGDMAKRPAAMQYFQNVAYLLGNHLTGFYLASDGSLGVHRFGQHDSSRFDSLLAKSADNRLIRATEGVVSMLTGNLPEPRVEPNSSMPEDEDAADLCEIVLRLVFEKPLNMPQKLRDAAMLLCAFGTAIAEVEYGETDNPVEIPRYTTKKRPNPLYEKGEDDETEAELDEQVQDGFEIAYRKDIMCRMWTPFHITPDPQATSPDDMTWIARTTYEDRDWVAQNYAKSDSGYFYSDEDKLKDKLQADRGTNHTLYHWYRVKDILETPQYYAMGGGMAPSNQYSMGGTSPNQVAFTVVDVKPSKAFPRGRTLVIAGGVLLYAGDARAWSEQYSWRWHGYAFAGWFRVPGRFWSVALLSELVPLQKRINSIDALVQANRQFMAFGQWFLPKSAKVQEGRISGFWGEHYVWNDTGSQHKPERVQNAPLPGELFAERDQLAMAMDKIAAVSTTDNQVAPSAARAGVMLNFLQQERMASKKPMLQDFEHFLETIAQNILIEFQLNLQQEDPELTRRVQIAAREHSSLSVQAFLGTSLRDHHSVKIDITSGLMNSPEAMGDKALTFMQFSGGQISPAEKQGILKAIKLDAFVENPENASVERARRIVSRVRTGQLEQVFRLPGESVSAMHPIFVDAILADTFNDLPSQQKQILLQYEAIYAQAVQEEQMRALQMQLALNQGGGSQPVG